MSYWNMMKHVRFSQLVRVLVRIIQLPLDRALGSLWTRHWITGSSWCQQNVSLRRPTLMKRSVMHIVRESDEVTKWQWVELDNQKVSFFWKALITFDYFTHFCSKCQEPHGGIQNLEPSHLPTRADKCRLRSPQEIRHSPMGILITDVYDVTIKYPWSRHGNSM